MKDREDKLGMDVEGKVHKGAKGEENERKRRYKKRKIKEEAKRKN